jgi:hypothetical protein
MATWIVHGIFLLSLIIADDVHGTSKPKKDKSPKILTNPRPRPICALTEEPKLLSLKSQNVDVENFKLELSSKIKMNIDNLINLKLKFVAAVKFFANFIFSYYRVDMVLYFVLMRVR